MLNKCRHERVKSALSMTYTKPPTLIHIIGNKDIIFYNWIKGIANPTTKNIALGYMGLTPIEL